MVVKKFNLTEKEVKQVSVALSLYVNELSKLGIGLDDKPELRSVLNLFSSCVVSLNK